MANFTISPNMNLPLPIPGTDLGPDYGANQNSAFTIVDGHTHTSGSGVPITPAAINVNSELPLNGNNLTLVNTVRFNNLSATLPGTSPNLGCIYEANNELIYNDGAGNVVSITKTGSVNAGAGSITGLPSGTASATYNSGNQTFVWQSATSTPANTDTASVIFRNLTASSKGVTVSAPSALAADYSLVWPLTPSAFSLVTLDNSGNMGTLLIGQGLQNVSGTFEIPNQGIQQVMLQTRTTGSTVAAGGFATSASCGAFTNATNAKVLITNFTVTITTTGRPVVVGFMFDGNLVGGDASLIGVQGTGGVSAFFSIWRGDDISGTQVHFSSLSTGAPPNFVPASSVLGIDVVAAGTYTYNAYAQGSTSTALVNYSILYAYEM